MAKELPYFKYFPSEWITGDITLCSMEAQGLFINLCCYYWNKNCSMSLANAKQRFIKHEKCFDELLNIGIIKHAENNLIINFLDEQMNEFIDVSCKRAKAGKKGGIAKAKQMLKSAVAKSSYKEKRKEDKKKIKEDKELLFKQQIFEFKEYSETMLNDFFNYWSEPDRKGNMRFEKEKTWEISRRLKKWHDNSLKFNKQPELKNTIKW